ncbi:MAG: hypothetical protein QOD92_3243 [Acidimicrobiaceae bacterium]|jgi:hypothetical protein
MTAAAQIDTLRSALNDNVVVEVQRSIRRADRLDGFVVGLGKRWLLMHLVDDVVMNGYAAVRLQDVNRARVRAGKGSFTLRALELADERPEPLSAVTLDAIGGVLSGLGQLFPLVSVHTENDHPDECYIGRPMNTTSRSLHLLEIDTDAVWEHKPTTWPLGSITRLDAGGRYETALAALGGEP